jgi:uncharacterized Zn finger protein
MGAILIQKTMKAIESNSPDMELIENLASRNGIDARQFVQETEILEDLERFEADRERRDQKILDLFQGMGYEQELEKTRQMAKADRIRMALVFYSNRQSQISEQSNGLAT